MARNKLAYLREKKGFEENRRVTQQEVANAVGVTKQHYNAVECGRNGGSFELWYKLAKFYGVNVEELRG